MLQECVSECGGTNVCLKIVFEARIFVVCIIQQNHCWRQQNHVAGNKIRHEKYWKTKLFCYGRR